MSAAHCLALALGIGGLWEALAVIVFLLAPIWRGIVEARKQARERRRADAEQGSATDEPEPAESPWGALLRGELPGQREGAQPPSEPAPARPRRASLELPPDLPQRTEILPPPDTEPRGAEVPSASLAPVSEPVEVGSSGLGSELPSFGAVDARSIEGVRTLGAALAQRTRAARGRRWRRTRHGAVDWRRAIVLSELVGPPVALRRPGADGPAGLR